MHKNLPSSVCPLRLVVIHANGYTVSWIADVNPCDTPIPSDYSSLGYDNAAAATARPSITRCRHWFQASRWIACSVTQDVLLFPLSWIRCRVCVGIWLQSNAVHHIAPRGARGLA
ncbi:hypothetical protein M9H77_30789 [Catharanthus roseus]|uniref:Uncharacterized protein n=1 Tax=Catharanthus roseus TaxID=4058 RepID=A0ACB9ZZJ9_CATRO|nr:hypothetical protein M9H77_30789 [Catharanthus roseus]